MEVDDVASAVEGCFDGGRLLRRVVASEAFRLWKGASLVVVVVYDGGGWRSLIFGGSSLVGGGSVFSGVGG